jgi:hypothetical protein
VIITFGPNHKAQDGTPLKDRFVRLEGPDPLACRMDAFAKFGAGWGFLYADEQAAGASEYGLTEYVLPQRGWLAHSLAAHRDGTECDACLHLAPSGQRLPHLSNPFANPLAT